MKSIAGILSVAMLVFCGVANAALLVDTGTPPEGGTPGGSVLTAVGPSVGQFIAGQFTLSSATTITGLEGFIGRGTAGTLTFALYTDGLNSAVPGSELFSTGLAIAGHGPPYSLDFGAWIGPSGLNWAVGPGTYWAAFEVRGSDTFSGVMPSSLPPNPLAHYSNTFKSTTYNANGPSVGVRVYGTVRDEGSTSVPEPGTLALLGFGLAALGFARRRKA